MFLKEDDVVVIEPEGILDIITKVETFDNLVHTMRNGLFDTIDIKTVVDAHNIIEAGY